MLFRVFVFSFLASFCLANEKRFIFFGGSAPSLEKYNVDKSKISVSGISSGAAMATQMHVIYSSHFMGVGMIAGPPFACTEGGGAASAVTVCMQNPSLVLPSALEAITNAGALAGNIDRTSNMLNDKVYIFDGKADTTVDPGIGPVNKRYYQHYVSNPNQIKTVFNVNAAHGQPTDNYGALCSQQSTTDFLNNCNYSAAYDLLNFIYGGHLKKPTPGATQTGQLKKFDQTTFFYITAPSMYSMDDVGYIYVPRACASGTQKCKLHVAIHGCKMGQKYIDDHYVRHGGYNEVADLNNIIILYPQAIKSLMLVNPNGCWDWWGYTGVLFATNKGFQTIAIKRMIDKVTG